MQHDPNKPANQDNSQDINQNIGKSFWFKLIMIPVGMFAFAFALVPLYDVLCDVTGLNGRINNSAYQGNAGIEIDVNHKISVDFMSATMPGFPVKFYPKVKKMDIIPGKIYTIQYIAENRSDKVITGQAVPSVAPAAATSHFKKLECFCFTNQEFAPKVPIEMPVKFFVDSKIDKNVHNITLSYNFFKVKESGTRKASVAGL